jgi:hypothetical protein
MRFRPAFLWLAVVVFASVGGASGCRWREPRTYEVKSSDPNAAYGVAKQVLSSRQYQATQKNDAARQITVRAHVDEDDDTNRSFITVNVTEDGRVQLSPSGGLVRADGKVHRALASEVASLEEAIQELLENPQKPPLVVAAASASAARPSGAPMAWNEAAYDPNTWGPGEFTCLPVKLPKEDQQTLKLKLSNGEEADVAISLAYAPELCRSPAQCPLPGGCPALGLGDAQQVARLAQRLVNKEIQGPASLLYRGQPVATLDLTRHGLVAKAMAQVKQAPPAASSNSDTGW